MTQDEILSMAREAGFGPAVEWTEMQPPFLRFAALVAAAEREACAAACEAVKQRAEELAKSDFATREGKNVHHAMAVGAQNSASAIRARGTNAS